jgi:DNA repair protein RadA/Sms
VAQTAARLKEAAKLGFGRAVLPESARGEVAGDAGQTLTSVSGLSTLVADIAARGSRKPQRESSGFEKNATPARIRRQDG